MIDTQLTPSRFKDIVINLILQIPYGKVTTYGNIAAAAGYNQAARQVSYILHSCSVKYGLPWHRVINKAGKISLPLAQGGALQKELLEEEGIVFSSAGFVDFDEFGWLPPKDLFEIEQGNE